MGRAYEAGISEGKFLRRGRILVSYDCMTNNTVTNNHTHLLACGCVKPDSPGFPGQVLQGVG